MAQPRKNRYATQTRTRRPRLGLLLILGGLLLAVLAAVFALRAAASGQATGGTPRLAVDQEKIDFGDVHFNQPVTATFTLTNTGDGLLRLTDKPYIEVKEGC